MPLSPMAPSPAAGATTEAASANVDVATPPNVITGTPAAGADGTTAIMCSSPSLSSLPTGPLAAAVLYLTEADLAQLLRTDKEMAHLNAGEIASDDFWRERCCNTFGAHADSLEPLGKDAFRAFLTAKRHLSEGNKRQPPPSLGEGERFDRLRRTDELLDSCAGASSQDRDDEDPANTLFPSRCATRMAMGLPNFSEGKLSQSECGCVFFRKCYWSSEPSPIAKKDEWIDYRMADGLAVVTSFVLTPYTSFWQPQAPTYNPVEAFFELSHPSINGGKHPYYESPRFRVEGVMRHQQFELPRPILSLGGNARVILSGMAQRQTLPEHAGETANHYHICISHVALVGAVLLSCSLAEGAPDRLADRVTGDNEAETVETTARETTIGVGVLTDRKGGDAPVVVTKTAGPADSISTSKGLVQRHPRGVLRLRWTVIVYVQPLVAASASRGKRDVDGDAMDPSASDGSILKIKIKAFSDTLCSEFLERYAQFRLPRKQPEDGRLKLLLASGPGGDRPLPTDAGSDAVLGDFASDGELDLIDASLCGGL
ncbi:unnamed protein product [Scytosiphon promiscuus]